MPLLHQLRGDIKLGKLASSAEAGRAALARCPAGEGDDARRRLSGVAAVLRRVILVICLERVDRRNTRSALHRIQNDLCAALSLWHRG